MGLKASKTDRNTTKDTTKQPGLRREKVFEKRMGHAGLLKQQFPVCPAAVLNVKSYAPITKQFF